MKKMNWLLSSLLVIPLLSGCAGTGFDKKAELMPDEVSVSVDSNPQKDWEIDEVTGGAKWKLK